MKPKKTKHKQTLIPTALVALVFTNPLVAQDTAIDDKAAAELAKKPANPVAALISVPVQNNWNFGIGPDGACASPSSSCSRNEQSTRG